MTKVAIFIHWLSEKSGIFGFGTLDLFLEVLIELIERKTGLRHKRFVTVGEPLLAGGTAQHSRIVLPPRIEEGFLKRWFCALAENETSHHEMVSYDDYWEYEQTVADLHKKCSLLDASQSPAHPPFYFMWFLWMELRVYGQHLNRVVETNRTLRTISESLGAAQVFCARAAARTRLKTSLDPLFEQLLDLRLRVVELEKDYWDKAYSLGRFRNEYSEDWQVAEANLMRALPDSLHVPALQQERNLDSTFQVRVAYLLRTYGSNPYGKRLSLRTISRLVLLVYVCAELATDIDDHLTIWGSNPHRELTVERTYETLRSAGLR